MDIIAAEYNNLGDDDDDEVLVDNEEGNLEAVGVIQVLRILEDL
jgi:hypothetical protein